MKTNEDVRIEVFRKGILKKEFDCRVIVTDGKITSFDEAGIKELAELPEGSYDLMWWLNDIPTHQTFEVKRY